MAGISPFITQGSQHPGSGLRCFTRYSSLLKKSRAQTCSRDIIGDSAAYDSCSYNHHIVMFLPHDGFLFHEKRSQNHPSMSSTHGEMSTALLSTANIDLCKII